MAPRKLVRAGVLAILVMAMAPTTAKAGIGPSQWCNDNVGPGSETLLVNTVISVAVEVGTSPPYLLVCYSTTTQGSDGGAVTGGAVRVPPDGSSSFCWRDTSPTVVAMDCKIRDDTPGSPGQTLDVTIFVQGVPTRIEAGIEVGIADELVCLRGTTITTPAVRVGPYDIGICRP